MNELKEVKSHSFLNCLTCIWHYARCLVLLQTGITISFQTLKPLVGQSPLFFIKCCKCFWCVFGCHVGEGCMWQSTEAACMCWMSLCAKAPHSTTFVFSSAWAPPPLPLQLSPLSPPPPTTPSETRCTPVSSMLLDCRDLFLQRTTYAVVSFYKW